MDQLRADARRFTELRAPQLVCFGPPVGPLGALVRLRLELGPSGPLSLMLSVELARSTFALLEHEGWFGAREDRRGPNLRGAFDSTLPVEVTLALAQAEVQARLGGDGAEREASLSSFIAGLRPNAGEPEDPNGWFLHDVTQAVPGRTIRLGFGVSRGP